VHKEAVSLEEKEERLLIEKLRKQSERKRTGTQAFPKCDRMFTILYGYD